MQVKDRQSLEKQERKFWKEYSKHKRELLLAEDEFRTIDLQNKYVSDQLDKLRKTNVFNQVSSLTTPIFYFHLACSFILLSH